MASNNLPLLLTLRVVVPLLAQPQDIYLTFLTHTVRIVVPPTPPNLEARPPQGPHSLEVAGVGEEGLWKGHTGFQDGDLNHPHNQHVRLEDVGTCGNKALKRE